MIRGHFGSQRNQSSMAPHRRSSQRLQKIPEDKRPYYGSGRKRTPPKEDTVRSRKTKLNKSTKPSSSSSSPKLDAIQPSSAAAGGKRKIAPGAEDDCNWLVPGSSLFDKNGINFTAMVKETLRLFNLYYLQFVKVIISTTPPFDFALCLYLFY